VPWFSPPKIEGQRLCKNESGALFYQLRLGRRGRVLAEVVRAAMVDAAAEVNGAASNMWRLVVNGAASDIVNLSRAKDAAALAAMRTFGIRNFRILHWDVGESRLEARTARKSEKRVQPPAEVRP